MFFANSRNILVTGGEFVNNSTTEYRTTSAFEKLQKVSAMGAMHDSSARFDPPKCHPNTRVALLEYILGWIFGRNDPEALILWLYGPAGAGKSAILQTIAEICAKRKSILASFFFGRNDPTCNTFKPLIPTISCQIAITIPKIRPRMELVIEHDPIIFDKSLATQLQSLIIHPLNDLIASGFFSNPETSPRLIIIDGLDECVDPKMQSMILRTLADALRAQKLPLIFLISSRPEQNIQLTFNSASLAGLWKSLVLDNTYKPNDDIRTFLVDSFQEIKSTHPHYRYIPNDWPSELIVDHLIRKSSGQFIYASVVIKYISATYDRPPHRLDVIMGLCPARREVPFAELDALYIHLLESCTDTALVMRILGVRLAGVHNVHHIESLLSLQPGDVELAVAPLSSVINITSFISLSHASFGDFLIDLTRSSDFHIDIFTTKEDLISTCVSMVMNPNLILNNTDSFDNYLGSIIHTLLSQTSPTDRIKESLMQLSLPHIWSIWEFQPCGIQQSQCRRQFWRSDFITMFLSAIYTVDEDDIKPSARTEEFQMIYQFHHSAFQPIFESDFQRYYRETELMHVVVLATVSNSVVIQFHPLLPDLSRILLQLSEESILTDECTFSIAADIRVVPAMFHYFEHLWTPIPAELYAQTTLKILTSLCNHPPRHIKFRSRSDKKKAVYPRCGTIYPKPSHTLCHLQTLRLQRAKRYQYGVKLCMPEGGNSHLSSSPFDICQLGLTLLPECLRQSSKSSELAGFIRSNGKKIPFIPKLTHEAICAMHEYLAQTQEDDSMNILKR